MTYATKINFNGGYDEKGLVWLDDNIEVSGMHISIDKNWLWKGNNPIEVEDWPTDPDVTTELQF